MINDACRLNPHVILITTSFGGHFGWLEESLNPSRWCIKPLNEYCIAILETTEKSWKNYSLFIYCEEKNNQKNKFEFELINY